LGVSLIASLPDGKTDDGADLQEDLKQAARDSRCRGGRAWMTLTWIARKAKNIPLDPMKNEGNRNAQ
jgi:hypothetical protein